MTPIICRIELIKFAKIKVTVFFKLVILVSTYLTANLFKSGMFFIFFKNNKTLLEFQTIVSRAFYENTRTIHLFKSQPIFSLSLHKHQKNYSN